jgi:peptidoglycan/xylan/chitin deacetylase (PgdA/CDA1 family)
MKWAPILMYHRVLPDTSGADRFACTTARLERQLRLLQKLGYRALTMSQLLGLGLRERSVGKFAALTFDDGTRDLVDHVLPLLDKYEAAATVFPVAGWTFDEPDEDSVQLTGYQLRALPPYIEIGSHGMSHLRLPGLSPEEMLAEVTGSRERLRDITGRHIDIFAYPYCAIDPAAVVAVAVAGYRAACGGPQSSHRRYSLQRLEVHRDRQLTFLMKITGLWSRLRSSGTVRALRRGAGGLRPSEAEP